MFRITLVQGLNRQIRRMCEHFGYEVTKLERTRIMNVSLKGLPLGEWRDLTDDELIELFKLIEGSSSEAKPAKKAPAKSAAAKSRAPAGRKAPTKPLRRPAANALPSGVRKRALNALRPRQARRCAAWRGRKLSTT